MTAQDDTTTSETKAALEELTGIRQSIDNIDAALVHLLAERFKFTQQVGRLKATHGLPAADPDRERRQIQRLRTLAEGAHLDPAFAEKWFNFVVAEVIHHHVKLAEGESSTMAPAVQPSSPVPAPAPAGKPTPTPATAPAAAPAPAAKPTPASVRPKPSPSHPAR